ncbi:hypothetical protein B0T10DRAFT_457436 [Thelonectria olida]|uniref:Uncharacterized protein n=1 Tax=Thelonectria olida TaxID=1576542 RepID=A0A9P8WBM3_9HYPO|nr:hypothetical protein B0T10DRAFT_457436 [Thelonectria olida]
MTLSRPGRRAATQPPVSVSGASEHKTITVCLPVFALQILGGLTCRGMSVAPLDVVPVNYLVMSPKSSFAADDQSMAQFYLGTMHGYYSNRVGAPTVRCSFETSLRFRSAQ